MNSFELNFEIVDAIFLGTLVSLWTAEVTLQVGGTSVWEGGEVS